MKMVTGGPDLLPDCSNYDRDAYPKALNTVDTIICRVIGDKLCVLLIKRKWNPFAGTWAIPGGFLDISRGEKLADAATRELLEETGASGIPVHQLGAYDTQDPRGPLITTVFYALVSEDRMAAQKIQAADDADDLLWVPVDELDATDIGFPHHRTILQDFLSSLRERVTREPLAFQLVPSVFTLPEVARVYQALLGRPVRNIRRYLDSKYVLVPAGKRRHTPHRPPETYRYSGEKGGI
jgi:8-oxo-dGTP diphosphatase